MPRETVSSPGVRAFRGLRSVPRPIERTCVGLGSGATRGADASRVRRLEHVEEEEEAELLGVLGRIGVAAAEEVVADAVDSAAEFRSERHRSR